jgi:hypothetical protein
MYELDITSLRQATQINSDETADAPPHSTYRQQTITSWAGRSYLLRREGDGIWKNIKDTTENVHRDVRRSRENMQSCVGGCR